MKSTPRQLRQRRGSLWRAEGDDAELVRRAKKQLEELLSDPYYYEAMQEMRREAPHRFRGLSGNAPIRGKRAAAWQSLLSGKSSNDPPPKSQRGRSTKNEWRKLGGLVRTLDRAVSRGEAKNATDAIRQLLTRGHPHASPANIKKLVMRFRQAVYEYRRQLKQRVGATSRSGEIPATRTRRKGPQTRR